MSSSSRVILDPTPRRFELRLLQLLFYNDHDPLTLWIYRNRNLRLKNVNAVVPKASVSTVAILDIL